MHSPWSCLVDCTLAGIFGRVLQLVVPSRLPHEARRSRDGFPHRINVLTRGLNSLRDAMHSVFLYHAIPKGLNMSIVNPGGLPRYKDIDAKTRKLSEEVILNKSDDGKHVERFLEFAEQVKNPPKSAAGAAGGGGGGPSKDAWREKGYVERLHH